jgi:hypothetical protein
MKQRPYTFIPLILIILFASAFLQYLQTPAPATRATQDTSVNTPATSVDTSTGDVSRDDVTMATSNSDTRPDTRDATIMNASFQGPLRVFEPNPIWLTDDSNEAMLVSGVHTWNALRDIGPTNPPPAFDFITFVDMMASYNHNFLRLWVWDMLQGVDANVYGREPNWVAPMPWQRISEEAMLEQDLAPAADGNPPFDVSQLDDSYFERLRERVIAAGERGLYVSIMLFEGFGPHFHDDGSHPFQGGNNINGIDVGRALDFYNDEALNNPEVWDKQIAYVNRVIDTVNDLENVLYEISNETPNESVNWQYAMIDHINAYQADKPQQHLVGITFMPGETFSSEDTRNELLYDSPADWVSPRQRDGEDWRNNPPVAGTVTDQIVILDTDHIDPGWAWDNPNWVWRTFLRGHHPIVMDAWRTPELLDVYTEEQELVLRRALGQARAYAQRVDLGAMRPSQEVASSRYALAGDREYLALAIGGTSLIVDLSDTPGTLNYEWFDWRNDQVAAKGQVEGGDVRTIDKPLDGSALLYLWAEQE